LPLLAGGSPVGGFVVGSGCGGSAFASGSWNGSSGVPTGSGANAGGGGSGVGVGVALGSFDGWLGGALGFAGGELGFAGGALGFAVGELGFGCAGMSCPGIGGSFGGPSSPAMHSSAATITAFTVPVERARHKGEGTEPEGNRPSRDRV
jgi:hypothetical protein